MQRTEARAQAEFVSRSSTIWIWDEERRRYGYAIDACVPSKPTVSVCVCARARTTDGCGRPSAHPSEWVSCSRSWVRDPNDSRKKSRVRVSDTNTTNKQAGDYNAEQNRTEQTKSGKQR